MKKLFIFIFTVTSYVSNAQNIGVGITTPVEKLQVDSVIKIGKNSPINGTTPNRKNLLKFGDGDYVTVGEELVDDKLYIRYGDLIVTKALSSNGSGYIGVNTEAPTANLDINGTLRLRGGAPSAGKVLTSDASGNATWEDKAASPVVAFSAVMNGSEGTQFFAPNTPKTILFTEEFDESNNYNPSTGLFTAPATGVYHFDANIHSTSGHTATRQLHLIKSGVVVKSTDNFTGGSQVLNCTVRLLAGETIGVQYEHNNTGAGNETLITASSKCFFSGFQVK